MARSGGTFPKRPGKPASGIPAGGSIYGPPSGMPATGVRASAETRALGHTNRGKPDAKANTARRLAQHEDHLDYLDAWVRSDKEKTSDRIGAVVAFGNRVLGLPVQTVNRRELPAGTVDYSQMPYEAKKKLYQAFLDAKKTITTQADD